MKEIKISKDNLILKVTTGSHLYGTETPDSDHDYHGVFIPPKEYVYGLQHCEQVIINDNGQDYTCYTLPKYVQLAVANNPNILTMLYTPEKHIHEVNKYGRELIEQRSLFLSKKAYHTFRGYAHSQKHKILTKQAEGKRVEIIEKHGYDTKFAMHLIRLLYEALDIMVAKELVYPSPQRQLFRAIRNGEWSLEKVLAEAERIEHLVDEAYARSDLQYSADVQTIEKFLIKTLEEYWRERENQKDPK